MLASTHVWNLIDNLSAAKERYLNQVGTANIVNFDRVCYIYCDTRAAADSDAVPLMCRT